MHIGYGNHIMGHRVVAILEPFSSPERFSPSAPLKRLRDKAEARGMLLDCTHGRKTRAYLITDSNHMILSGVDVETLVARQEAEARPG